MTPVASPIDAARPVTAASQPQGSAERVRPEEGGAIAAALAGAVPDLSLAGLRKRLNYVQAMYDHRFKGQLNIGPQLMTKAGKLKEYRLAAAKNLKDAHAALDGFTEGTLDDATAHRVTDLLNRTISDECIPDPAKPAPPDKQIAAWRSVNLAHRALRALKGDKKSVDAPTTRELLTLLRKAGDTITENARQANVEGGWTLASEKLQEALRELEAANGQPLAPLVAAKVTKLVGETASAISFPMVKEGALREGDGGLDDRTEYGISNLSCILAALATERFNDRLEEAPGGKRLDAPGNYKGWFQEFVFKTGIYFTGIAAARGRNFYSQIDPETGKRKFEHKFPTIEMIGSIMMVAGALAGNKLMDKFVTPYIMNSRVGKWMNARYRQTGKLISSLVSSAVAGFGAGYFVYWLAGKWVPMAINSTPLKGAKRATVNVVIRQGLQPFFQSRASRDREAAREAAKTAQMSDNTPAPEVAT